MRLPLVLFVLAPLFEIAGFVLVGSAIGVLPTLGLVILSAMLGFALLRIQGAGILQRLQDEAKRGVDPGRQLVHAALLVVAAVLLIIPGFLGDIIGLLLFIPVVRDLAWRLVRPRVIVRGGFTRASGFSHPTADGNVVDLDADEYRTETRTDTPWRGPRIGKD
ncbi:FxsA family protein [Rhizobium sp. AAP43]|uniref:FxsA family protein n=1 Tax=Rhizobium sp. AAP43 TaxID=1523420 RepID=UPI0006B94E55|nr:FxsA family protein [Rhizobium sp. AAP43]KPF42957.1 exclusion suppressor FxsA [Rhizobium sp. AAP43]